MLTLSLYGYPTEVAGSILYYPVDIDTLSPKEANYDILNLGWSARGEVTCRHLMLVAWPDMG
jgi:hypothetical protein